MRKSRALVIQIFCLWLAAVGAADAATITVNRTSSRAGDGGCGFEEAIAALNAGRGSGECPYSGTGAMRINIPSGTYNTGLGVQIRRSVTIAGAGRDATSLQFATTNTTGAMAMTIAPYLAVTIQDLSLRGSPYAQGLNNNGAMVSLLRTTVADFGFGGSFQIPLTRMARSFPPYCTVWFTRHPSFSNTPWLMGLNTYSSAKPDWRAIFSISAAKAEATPWPR